jgi:phage terminase large subunit-like protein
MGDIRYHAREAGLKVLKGLVEYPNGTVIKSLSQSYRSIAGARHAMTVWDELWGYSSEDSRRAWDEMTPIPTIPNSLRVVATYAGFENSSDLLWDLYLQGVGPEENEHGQGKPIPELADLPCWQNGRLFTFWDHEPRMPWQTDEYYESQRKSLRPSAYIRLHTNSWTNSSEEFIPIEWWDRACEAYAGPADQIPDHPFKGSEIVISADASTKRDCTAVSGWAHDSVRGKTIQMFHKIWTPAPGEDFDLEATVEAWILEKRKTFNIRIVVYDPRDLHQTMVRLRARGVNCVEYTQSVINMVKASQGFYDALKYNNIEAYPDEEWRKHIQMAVAETKGGGFRIVKDKGNRKSHVDGAVSSAMGVYMCIQGSDLFTGEEVRIQSPFADSSTWKQDSQQMQFSFEFQDN